MTRPFPLAVAALAALLLTTAPWGARGAEPPVLCETLPTTSSFLHDVTWTPNPAPADDGTLSLTLGDDPETVRYFEVPRTEWEAFKSAPSPGSFYATNIRQAYERQYGASRQEKFDSPIPIQTQIDALCAFNEECEPVVLEAIQKTHTSIYIACYAFTRTRIARALLDAHARGVHIAVKMDIRQAEHPGAKRILALFREAGIPVTLIYTTGEYSAMHNKFMIFDMRWVVTGSYNYTTQAQVSNWENLLWLDSPSMAEQYKQAWDAIVSDTLPSK